MKWTHWILYFVALPWNLLVAWPAVLLIRLFWGEDLRWETPPPYDRKRGGGGGPCLTCRIRAGSFPVTSGTWPKGWYLYRDGDKVYAWGGTTLGHGIFYGPKGRKGLAEWTRIQAHEHVHVEQAEVAMLRSFITGLAAGAPLWAFGHSGPGVAVFLVIWACGYLMMGISGWLTAVLRGEEAYWGSSHEESARAQDDRLAGRK